jgi:hypothetical protein
MFPCTGGRKAESLIAGGGSIKAPNSKLQASEKHQTPKSKPAACAIEVWRLVLLWCLDVGARNFYFFASLRLCVRIPASAQLPI